MPLDVSAAMGKAESRERKADAGVLDDDGRQNSLPVERRSCYVTYSQRPMIRLGASSITVVAASTKPSLPSLE